MVGKSHCQLEYDYSRQETRVACDRLQASLYGRDATINAITTSLKTALADYDIVYLPTYRRVELTLTDDNREQSYRKKRRAKFKVATGSLFTGDIQFGLSDIYDRLA